MSNIIYNDIICSTPNFAGNLESFSSFFGQKLNGFLGTDFRFPEKLSLQSNFPNQRQVPHNHRESHQMETISAPFVLAVVM